MGNHEIFALTGITIQNERVCVDRVCEVWGHAAALLSPNQYGPEDVWGLMRRRRGKVSYEASSGCADLLRESSVGSDGNVSGTLRSVPRSAFALLSGLIWPRSCRLWCRAAVFVWERDVPPRPSEERSTEMSQMFCSFEQSCRIGDNHNKEKPLWGHRGRVWKYQNYV